MNRKAVIFGVKSYRLTNKEKQLFKKVKPWGIILFSRNIRNISQVKTLTDEIKQVLNVDENKDSNNESNNENQNSLEKSILEKISD